MEGYWPRVKENVKVAARERGVMIGTLRMPMNDNLHPRELYLEISEGDVFQIWRVPIYLRENEDDIRAALGKALKELGQYVGRSHGEKLVPPPPIG